MAVEHIVTMWFFIKRSIFHLVAALLTMAGLFGCAAAGDQSAGRTGDIPALPFVARFELTARVSVRVADKLEIVKINWLRSPPDEVLNIFTPFGAQLAKMVVDQNGATIKRADEPNASIRAATAADLLAAGIGVSIDTGALARGVQGFDLQTRHELTAVADAGAVKMWDVRVENFRVIDGARVASRITATSGDTVVRVVIDEFQAR